MRHSLSNPAGATGADPVNGQFAVDLLAALDVHAIVSVADTRGVITHANAKFCEISGYSKEELIGQDHRMLNSGHHPRSFFRDMWSTIGRGDVWRGEIQNRAKDGSCYWVDSTIVPLFDDDGRVRKYVSIRTDITRRKQEAAAQTLLAALVASSMDAIISLDKCGRILSWNRGAELAFGYLEAEMTGRSAMELVPADARQAESNRLAVVLGGESFRQFETVLLHKDGRRLNVIASASPLLDGEGRILGTAHVARDVTAQKKLESQFLRSQRMEAIGSLAGGVAHDLNNLLSPMLMVRSLIKPEHCTRNERQLLDTVHQAARRAAAIVRQLLDFSRGREGNRQAIPVAPVFREATAFLRETLPRDIVIKSSIQSGLWPVVADSTQLHQVLVNLCVNARDAMRGGGTLCLTAENIECDGAVLPGAQAGRFVLFTVADTGVGIPPNITDRIFDPFFTTKEPGSGTGLGLSTVAGIVKNHGGYVTVYSEPGVGSSFHVYLPAAGQPEQRAPAPVERAAGGSGEGILLVDDEPAILASVANLLQKRNYRVLLAREGREAMDIWRLRAADIALVITDTMMPGVSGPQLVKELRACAPKLPVIATTGLENEDKLRDYAAQGVDDVLVKPYDPEELLRLIRRKIDAAGRVALDGDASAGHAPK